MKTLTVRLSERLAADIAEESRRRGISKSDVVRARLERVEAPVEEPADPLADIRDLIGSVEDDLPADLSTRTDHYLRALGYGGKRRR